MTTVSNVTSAASWGYPPPALNIESNEIQVWRAVLNEPAASIDHYLHTLAVDEQRKAERFYFQRDREHFIIAHGVLRALLGRYLNRPPESVSFCYSEHGKPSLAPESGEATIRFNMSHSQGMALYAVARNREVGVDLEFVRRDLEAEQIAERFFSGREIAELHALPAELRREAFFLCWTRKEAYIKARGEGLSLPLDQFDVSLTPGEPAALLSTRPDSAEALRWSLRELTAGHGYVAAIAAQGGAWSLSCWQADGWR